MDSSKVLFCEQHAAAQSLKNTWTRLASTYGCMLIVLSQKTLVIKPHWFAKWLVTLLHLDLCHEIPIASIKSVMEIGKGSDYGKIKLHFETVDGKDQNVLLYMKKYRDFLDQVRSLINK